MVYIVKESFNVKFDNVMQMALLYSIICICYCIFYRTIWSKSVAVLAELCLTDWFQYLLKTLLNQSIPYARNPQWTCCSICFWNFPSSYCFRTIPPFCSLYYISNFFNDLFWRKPFDVINSHSVSTGCVAPCICFYLSVCEQYIFLTKYIFH